MILDSSPKAHPRLRYIPVNRLFRVSPLFQMASKRDKKIPARRPDDHAKFAEAEQCRKLLDQGVLGWKMSLGPRLSGHLPSSQESLLSEMTWLAADMFETRKFARHQCRVIAAAVDEFWRHRRCTPQQSSAAIAQLFFATVAAEVAPSAVPPGIQRVAFSPLQEPVPDPQGRGLKGEWVPKTPCTTRSNAVSADLKEYASLMIKTSLKAEGVANNPSANASSLSAAPLHTPAPVLFPPELPIIKVKSLNRLGASMKKGDLEKSVAAPAFGMGAIFSKSETESAKSMLLELELTSLMNRHTELFAMATESLDLSAVRVKKEERNRRGAVSAEEHALRKCFLSSVLSAYRHNTGSPWPEAEERLLCKLHRMESVNWHWLVVALGLKLSGFRLRPDFSRSAVQCERRWKHRVENEMEVEDGEQVAVVSKRIMIPLHPIRTSPIKASSMGNTWKFLPDRLPLNPPTVYAPVERRSVVSRRARQPTVATSVESPGGFGLFPHSLTICNSSVPSFPHSLDLILSGSSGRFHSFPGLATPDEKTSSGMAACVQERKRQPPPLVAFSEILNSSSNPTPQWDAIDEQSLIRQGLQLSEISDLHGEDFARVFSSIILASYGNGSVTRTIKPAASQRPKKPGRLNNRPPPGSLNPSPPAMSAFRVINSGNSREIPGSVNTSSFSLMHQQSISHGNLAPTTAATTGSLASLMTGGVFGEGRKRQKDNQGLPQLIIPTIPAPKRPSAASPPPIPAATPPPSRKPAIPVLTIPNNTLPPIATRSGTILQPPVRRPGAPPKRAASGHK